MVQNKPVGYQGLQLWFHKLAPPPMASSNQQQFKIEYVSWNSLNLNSWLPCFGQFCLYY